MSKDLKGIKNGNCNRTSCQKPGAVYYNHSTRLYYCKTCADEINRVNRADAMRMFGHELCTIDESTPPSISAEGVLKKLYVKEKATGKIWPVTEYHGAGGFDHNWVSVTKEEKYPGAEVLKIGESCEWYWGESKGIAVKEVAVAFHEWIKHMPSYKDGSSIIIYVGNKNNVTIDDAFIYWMINIYKK